MKNSLKANEQKKSWCALCNMILYKPWHSLRTLAFYRSHKFLNRFYFLSVFLFALVMMKHNGKMVLTKRFCVQKNKKKDQQSIRNNEQFYNAEEKDREYTSFVVNPLAFILLLGGCGNIIALEHGSLSFHSFQFCF